MPAQSINSTTQQFLDIYDITDDCTIMKSGHVSMILSVAAMNFGLLAEEEQDAIMYAYAGLLNSLNYPIQVVVHSQTKDVTNYLQLLKQQEEIIANPTMRRRIVSYRDFVANLIHERNVLDKKFYVVISASAIELGFIGTSTFVPGKSGSFNIESVEKHVLLDKAKSILEPRRDHLVGQFARIGLFSQQLHTQEIIQLFYLSYNPEAAEGQQITDSRSYTSPLVRATMEESVLDQPQPQPAPSDQVPAATPTSSTPPAAAANTIADPTAGAGPVAGTPTSAQPMAPNVPGASMSPMSLPSPTTVVEPAMTTPSTGAATPTMGATTSVTPAAGDSSAPAPIPSVFSPDASSGIKIEAADKPPIGLNVASAPAASAPAASATPPATPPTTEDPQAAINSLIGQADVPSDAATAESSATTPSVATTPPPLT